MFYIKQHCLNNPYSWYQYIFFYILSRYYNQFDNLIGNSSIINLFRLVLGLHSQQQMIPYMFQQDNKVHYLRYIIHIVLSLFYICYNFVIDIYKEYKIGLKVTIYDTYLYIIYSWCLERHKVNNQGNRMDFFNKQLLFSLQVLLKYSQVNIHYIYQIFLVSRSCNYRWCIV